MSATQETSIHENGHPTTSHSPTTSGDFLFGNKFTSLSALRQKVYQVGIFKHLEDLVLKFEKIINMRNIFHSEIPMHISYESCGVLVRFAARHNAKGQRQYTGQQVGCGP
jgi:hypothetical protein